MIHGLKQQKQRIRYAETQELKKPETEQSKEKIKLLAIAKVKTARKIEAATTKLQKKRNATTRPHKFRRTTVGGRRRIHAKKK